MVVCTRNRVDALAECLGSVARQRVSPERLEVVVVDNGSNDGTRTWLDRWAAADPARRRVVTEPRTGLSRSRNRGLEAARHDVVLFIDDDALAHEAWVEAHLRHYRDQADVGAIGGPVVLSWPNGRPRWLGPELEHWFSALDLGPNSMPFPPPHGPYGTNMSVRRLELVAAGGFAVELGRRGRSLVSGEEHDLFSRLWARGVRIEYEPDAVVTHQVPRDRLSRRWILRRGWAQGRGNARMQRRARMLGGPGLRLTCRGEARFAVSGLGELGRLVGHGGSGALLNDVARRSGHVAAVVEHVWLWAGDIVSGPRDLSS